MAPNNADEHWDEGHVNKQLSDLMQTAVKDMFAYAKQHDITFKEAGFAMAIKRLVE